jgi:EpsI family protein
MKANRRTLYLFTALVLVLAAALLSYLGSEVRPQKLQSPLDRLPRVIDGWQAMAPDRKLDNRTLELLKPQNYLLRNYHNNGRNIALFVAYFGLQQEGQMIHSPRNCLPGGGWKIASRKLVTVPGPNGGWKVNHLILESELDRLSVLYWYQGRDRVEPNEYWERLSLITDAVRMRRNDGALLRLTTIVPRQGSQEIVDAEIKMAAALIPAMERLLPPASGADEPADTTRP